MSNYTPTAEQIARMRDEHRDATGMWVSAHDAQYMLKRQHEREKGLLELLNEATYELPFCHEFKRKVERALAAHARLDAPPEPTLLEAAKQVVSNVTVDVLKFDLGTHITLNGWPTAIEDIRALKAAVEREERAK